MASLVRKIISTAKAPRPAKGSPYNQAVSFNNTVYLSGVLGVDQNLKIVQGGVGAEARQALESIGHILEAAGSCYKNVIKCNIMLNDINDFSTVNDVYKEFFCEDFPARSTYQVSLYDRFVCLAQTAECVVSLENRSEVVLRIAIKRLRNHRDGVFRYEPARLDDQPSEITDDESYGPELDFQLSEPSGCFGNILPIPFERASRKSWWDPTFDSDILEDQYKTTSYANSRIKFRFALGYTMGMALGWLVYIICNGLLTTSNYWFVKTLLLLILLLYNIFVLLLTYTDTFKKHMFTICFVYALSCILISFLFAISTRKLSVGHFSACVQLLILFYTLIPLKLYVGLSLAVLYSVFFELTVVFILAPEEDSIETTSSIITKIFSHLATHLIGFHIYLMNNIRLRETFMKVGQSILVRKQLELEKKFKENMIHSLMPPSVVQWLMKSDENFTRRQSAESENNDIRSLFRPFIMDTMSNVSILFADIVGFTKMSGNKSAEELVEILNDLFQRFDDLCKENNCEKISTLGDCYYCVSGCPKPRDDHAHSCVEMGLSMIKAIKKFDQEKHEGVNMRVGIHTGTVLCGIVGTRRIKFDVWSNDVTLANKMESTGRPGMVHISEKTCNFLEDRYFLEDGDCVSGLKTYFILGRRTDKSPSYQGSFRSEGRQKYANSLQLFVSPPSFSASLSPQSRPRVLSCDTPHVKTQNKNYLSPDSCIMKASSLPSILDSENEQDPPDGGNVENVKTPTSTASSGKYSMKLRNWKMPKFMRKSSATSSKPDIDVDFVSGATDASEDGYQQVPTIIETDSFHRKKKDSCVTLTYNDFPLNKDMLDIKSYISHSRSDIGAFDYSATPDFTRGGSYHSQFGRSYNGDFTVLNRAGSSRSRRGRSPNQDGLEPLERARSATVTVSNFYRPKRSLDIPSRLSSMAKLDDYSAQSRKDSGIKSNSRRSSIQQLDNIHINQEVLKHGVSGYYTSSQSSVNSIPTSKPPKPVPATPLGMHPRKQSDKQLIRCIQDNIDAKYLYTIPPISPWSLFFKDRFMEQEYRANVHYVPTHVEPHQMNTLANSQFNTYFDIFISVTVFLIVSIGLAVVFGITTLWLVTFLVCSLFQVLNLALFAVPVIEWIDRTCRCSSRFCRWNLFGAILVSLPMISAIVNFGPDEDISYSHTHMFTYLLFVGLIHFCNFTQINCWLKNVTATLISASFLILSMVNKCSGEFNGGDVNETRVTPVLSEEFHRRNETSIGTRFADDPKCYFQNFDLMMNLLMLLVLVWLLNRRFEIGYRHNFHANHVATRNKARIQKMKNQADYLFYNIVPMHVADQLKQQAKYSENFKEVGIIFASIVNFNEMYDESFEGGKEYLRVLNELVGDFDELLDRVSFDCVEKIKTIGSTFMAASGLNSDKRARQGDPHAHLYALMEFAMEMQRVVENFNINLLEFNLILRIGYNFGDVTAAVIGNTKLYYDIWGDAVNIASRMDSTGVNGRIQVGEHCLPILERCFDFEHRGPVYVKGKDNMNVFLLKGRKPETNPDLLNIPDEK
ncbi:hypothetical protein GWI33_023316 [Rhynchophorus ferrugineus]|uniref:Adenylate cyclase type 9 n=1 Tax=Rhynchophorus ferrugineus TaxID=354439 RepID=A0A834HZP0_RHYFE|nr:hypothetical protein GWI33_023316 [Rhynchophorus ferrugineus]